MAIIKQKLFYNPFAFWFGCAAITLGVLSHVPMFLHCASMGFKMVGMKMDVEMWIGMGLIPAGLLLSAYGLYPGRMSLEENDRRSYFEFGTTDNLRLNTEHWKLIFALFVAVAVDVMKPATLGFVLPGMTREYEISNLAGGKLVLFALSGTALGSILWGVASDRIGRRATILLSALMFVGTSICGAMPSFSWNIAMCFLMGMSAGGLLPITFALMAETVPARHRGWLLVALGGFGTGAGYLLASGAASLLEPLFSWRILWLLGLPTGLLLIFLNHYIPESPRYLVKKGMKKEAEAVLARFSGSMNSSNWIVKNRSEQETKQNISSIFQGKYLLISTGLIVSSLAWGIVNFGFLLWLPTNLRTFGFEQQADVLIAQSAIVALPAMVFVVFLYHWWSSIYTLITFVILTGCSLLLFCVIDWMDYYTQEILFVSIAVLLVSVSGLIAMLIPYSAEIYPVGVRGAGVGLIAGSSKMGGILGSILGMLGFFEELAGMAIVVAIVLFVSGFVLFRSGINTKGLRLEDIHSQFEVRGSKRCV